MLKEKRLLKLEDLKEIEYVTDPIISPDGQRVVFVKLKADEESGDFIPHIYEVDINGGFVKRLINTDGASECKPSFSPNGDKIAYISTSTGEKQIWILDLKSNNAYQLTTIRHGVTDYAWSPDGKKIAFEAPLWPDESEEIIYKEMTKEEREEWLWNKENMPIVVEKLMYKFDETYGVADGSYSQIGVIDLETKSAKIVTNRTQNYSSVSWSHDGQRLACFGYPYYHHNATKKELFVINILNGEIKQLTTDEAYKETVTPLFTKDDNYIIYVGLFDNEDKFVCKPIRVSVEGGEKSVIFPEEEICHGVAPYSAGKTVFGKIKPQVQLSDNGEYLYFISTWHGYTHVYRMNLEGEPKIEQVTKGDISVSGFYKPINNKLVYTRGDFTTIDEVFCLDLNTGKEKRLTFSNQWLNDVYISIPEEMWVPSKDGKVKIHGWFVPPAKLEEDKSYPIVIYIHGGPEVCYTAGWWHEVQMLSAKGVAVAYCDPRGSVGYGAEYIGDDFAWGQEAYDDLIAFLEVAEEKHSYIDSNREGVTGGSYGGYMTNKLIGTTTRFKAAVTQRTFCNQATSYGTGDMGFISSMGKDRPKFYDYMLNRAKKSLINMVDNIKTPLLILHGTHDYRCSFEQGEQIFVAMKARNPEVPVRLVAFPGENHEITRSRKIHFQIAHLKEMVDWFVKYLCNNGGDFNE